MRMFNHENITLWTIHLFIFSLAYVGNASGIQACMNSAILILMALHQWVLYPIQTSLRCLHINQIHHHYNLQHGHSCHKSDDRPSSFSYRLRNYHTSYSSLAFKYNSISSAFFIHLIQSSENLIYSPHSWLISFPHLPTAFNIVMFHTEIHIHLLTY